MKKITKLWHCIFPVVLIFLSNTASADDQYQIELLIFAQDMPDSEVFDQIQSEIKWPGQVDELHSNNVLPPSKRMMNAMYSDLSRSFDYKPLLHIAWVQAIPASGRSEAFRVQDGRNGLDGYIQFNQNNDLKLTVDLEFQPEPDRFFHLRETRKIRQNEEHYFDHPKFGVVAKIRLR